MNRRLCFALSTALATVVLLVGVPTGSAQAEHRGGGHGHHHRDARHGHGGHHHRRGHIVHSLPPGSHTIVLGGSHLYYRRGDFYRRHHGSFVVVSPPIGAVVSVLPGWYTTLYVGGLPYYYVNSTYYLWDADVPGYRVVEEPVGASESASTATELFVYPARGQSEARQADDRYECHAWAVAQTRFDPSRPLEAAQRTRAGTLRSEYQRAIRACLEARGYTVR